MLSDVIGGSPSVEMELYDGSAEPKRYKIKSVMKNSVNPIFMHNIDVEVRAYELTR